VSAAAPPPRRSGRPPRPHREALSDADRERLRYVMDRLRGRVAAVLATLPSDTSSDSGLARRLGLDRVTTHRVVRLARGGEDLHELLKRAPGVRGVRAFADACAGIGVPRRLVEELSDATAAYDAVLSELGGNKSAVERRLAVHAGAVAPRAGGVADEENRAAVYRDMAAILGREVGFRADINVFRPSPEQNGMLDFAHARALIGCRSRAGAMPLHIGMVGRVLRREQDAPAGHRAVGRASLDGGAVLEAFSTSPPPLVASRGEGDRVRHVIDAGGGTPVDVVVAHESRASCRDPKEEDPPRLESGALVRDPTGALVLDVWVDRGWLGDREPDLGLYQWSPGLDQGLSDHWLDRLPHAPEMERLASPAAASVDLWPRHAELTWDLFTRLGWDPERFVGFRCRTPVPLYGGGYYFAFDLA